MTPVSDSDLAWPLKLRFFPLSISEKELRLWEMGGASWVWPVFWTVSVLCAELLEPLRLRLPRFPMARYSGPSSPSQSPPSEGAGLTGWVEPVLEFWVITWSTMLWSTMLWSVLKHVHGAPVALTDTAASIMHTCTPTQHTQLKWVQWIYIRNFNTSFPHTICIRFTCSLTVLSHRCGEVYLYCSRCIKYLSCLWMSRMECVCVWKLQTGHTAERRADQQEHTPSSGTAAEHTVRHMLLGDTRRACSLHSTPV